MKKTLGFISASGIYLTSAIKVLASNGVGSSITIPVPAGYAGSTSVDISKIPSFILTLLLVVGVVIALAFLVYGGIKWILSGGDKAGVDAARKHIVAAIIGLVIVITAFVIVNIVFQLVGIPNPLTGNFCIPSLTNPTCQ